MNRNIKLFFVIALTSLVGIALGWLLKGRLVSDAPIQTTAIKNAERKILYYRNPMNPEVHADKPMQDSMGMDYVPVYADEAPGENGMSIGINSQMVQKLGVRTAKAVRRALTSKIETVGSVAINENGITYLNPKISGWVEQVKVKAVGESVKQGQVLAEIYSPELVNAQEEYLLAVRGDYRLQNSSTSVRLDSQALLDAARQRLSLLDISADEIQALEERGEMRRTLPLRAPYTGVITELGMREGGRVTPDSRLLSLADLSQVWVNVEIYTHQLPFVKRGDNITLTLPFIPGRYWKGHIDFIYPTLNAESRTVQARLVIPNADGMLRPGMYANAGIQTGERKTVLTVPRQAVIHNGQENFVVRALGEGRFLASEVRTGIENADDIEIVEGLEEGQEIVVNGQFLLDSEASMRGVLHRLGGNQESAEINSKK